MKTTRLSTWLQVLGNVAIMIGLVFVALQLYQDRQLKSIEMSMLQLDNALQVRLALMGEEPEKALVESLNETGELTREDALILREVYAAELILFEQTTAMQRVGLWPEYPVAIPVSMRTPSGYRYIDANIQTLPLSDSTKLIWREFVESGLYSDDFAVVVDGIRSDDAASVVKERIRKFRESL
jgi:hypothetical protein